MTDSDPVIRLNAALEGRYAIKRELGEGGMATVYLAKDLKHHRNVALKVLKSELAAVVGAERFLAEIQVDNGHFCATWGALAHAVGLTVDVLPWDWRRPVDPAALEEHLGGDKDHQIKAVLVTHNSRMHCLNATLHVNIPRNAFSLS